MWRAVSSLPACTRAYDFKQIADYETSGASTSAAEAAATIDQAAAFVTRIAQRLATP